VKSWGLQPTKNPGCEDAEGWFNSL